MVKPTNDPYSLQLDLAATDFLADAPEPAYLYYNPWPEQRTVMVPLGEGPQDLVELGSGQVPARAAISEAPVELPPKTAYVIGIYPAKGGA